MPTYQSENRNWPRLGGLSSGGSPVGPPPGFGLGCQNCRLSSAMRSPFSSLYV